MLKVWVEHEAEVVVEISPLLGRARRAGAANDAERVLDIRARQIQALQAEVRDLRGQLTELG